MSFEFDLEEITNESKTDEVKKQARILCKCKKCGSDIIELPLFYACKDYCGVKIWKEFLYKKLTEEEVRGLLEGKEVHLVGLKSKNGKVFNAFAFYDFDQCKVILRFEESNGQGKESKHNKQNKQDSKSKQKKSKK